MKNLVLLTITMLICWKLFGPDTIVELGPGVMVTGVPQQTEPVNIKPFDHKNYRITPLADFKIEAKVLSKTDYRLGRESDLSPVDLALGWQNMSDESVLEKITISQSNRWYFWRVQQLPIPRHEIETQSANMHMVPADDQLAEMLSKVKQGEIIELTGHLIRVDSDDGWHWQSSLTRNDTGAHSCEVVYVKALQKVE